MSILDDIGHVAKEAWGHGVSTAESFGGAALAGPGLIWDIASSPKDIKDDLFRALGRFTDPLTNTSTFSGALAAPLIDASMTGYREAISEPVSTAVIMLEHANPNAHTWNVGDLFSADAWSQAYEIAQHQSIGQSIAFGGGAALNGDWGQGKDPFDYKDPYKDTIYKEHPFLAGTLSGTLDAAANWYLDPLVLAGKGAKGVKVLKSRPITAADKLAGIRSLAETESVRKLRIPPFRVDGLKTQFDTLTGTIDGGKHTPGYIDGRDATDLYNGLRMQDKANGRQIAGLLADTNAEQNVAKRINGRRTILATLAGDTKTAADFEDLSAHITDGLENIANETVTGVEANAVYDSVASALADKGLLGMIPSASKAENFAEAERQLDNLPDLQEFLTDSERLVNKLLANQNTLKAIPKTSAAGYRATGRMAGKGLFRGGQANTGYSLADDILDRTLGRPLQSYYQYSSTHMPLRVIHGLTVKTLEAGPKFTDSFRNIRPEFVLNMSDLEDVTKNVDAYARRAGVSLEKRHQYINELSSTTLPIQRAAVVEKVEREAKKALLLKHNIPEDISADDLDNFVAGLMKRYHHRRDAMVTSLQGRAFSATKVAENSPRMQRIKKLAQEQGVADKFEWKNWSVDQFLDDGTPTHLPFLDTQDISLMPMMPLDEVDRVLARHGNVFRAALRSWKEDALTGGPLADLKRAAGTAATFGFEKGDFLFDNMVDILDMVNRAWKFTALFRLGYPIRIITDDHSRALAAHGSKVILGGIGHGLEHAALNAARPWNNRWLATQLRAEREVLDHYIASPELLARNQAAWGEIADISKKLETVKSARRSGELKARLQMLKEFHPEDLAGTVARRDEIDKILTSKSYRVDKEAIGKKGFYADIAGEKQYLPGAFEGRGEVYRGAISGVGDWGETFGRTEQSMYKNFSNSGSYKIYRATDNEQLHREAWAEVVNHNLRNSEVARIVIDGGTKEDVLKFLRTPRGREVIRKVPHQGANPDWWAHDVERMVDEYLPSPEIRALAKQREVTAADLKAHFPDVESRPMVHGQEAGQVMGNSRHATMWNKSLTAFYKWVGTRNDVMSRHPLFHALYKDEVARQAEHRALVASERGLALTGEDVEKAAHAAREYAKKGVNRVLFEMGGTPEIAHFMRFVSPFMAPWMEGLNRWGRIVRDDPSVARRFFMVFDAPRAAGLEIDQDGNPVPKGAPIGDSHYILFQLPQGLGGPDPQQHQSGIKVSETSFNMIMQGGGLFNPGFGPLVQIPVNEYAVRNPEDETIQKSIKAVLPFGTTSDTALGMWTPAVVDAGWSVASAKFFNHHSRQYIQMQNMLWRDKLIQFELDHNGRTPNQTEKNDMFAEAGKDASAMAGMKFLASALSPASLQIQSKFTAQQQAFYRLQEQGRIEKKPYYWAEEQFIKQWGEAYFPLVRSSSWNESGVSSTVGTVAALKKYKGTLDRVDPSMYRMIVSGEGEGAYSPTARNWLYTTAQRTGDTQTFIEQSNPRQAMQDTLTSQGWYDYSALMNRLNLRAQAQGLTSYLDSAQLQLAKKKGLALLAQKNPAWWQDYNSFSPVEYDKKLADMRVIAHDVLQTDPTRSDMKTLQQYLALRDWATNVLQQRGAVGGSSSPEALSNRDVLSLFTRQVSRLTESNLWFDQYAFTSYIEHDPYLLDAGSLVPSGALQAAA